MPSFEQIGMTVLYLTVALIVLTGAVGVLIYKFRKQSFPDFIKYAVGIALGYATVVIVLMTYIKFAEIRAEGSFVPELFYPILSILIVVIAGGIATFIAAAFGKKSMRISLVISGLLLLGALIGTFVVMSNYYGDVSEWYPSANTQNLIICGVVFSAALVGMYFIADKREVNETRAIVYGAVCIAMSFALSYVRLFRLPQGGSITFASLLPLMVYCCMFGTRRGIIVALIYGVLQAIQDPFIIHPMQFLLDYPLAFGFIGFSGMLVEKKVFKNKKVLAFILGGTVAVVFRFLCHVLSGMYAFADYANLEKYSTVLAYSCGYNSFALIDMAIALACGSLLFASKAFVNQMNRASAPAVTVTVETDTDDEDELENLE